MGIIDTMINQNLNLIQMLNIIYVKLILMYYKNENRWMVRKPNVIILEGRWQDKLNDLLSSSSSSEASVFDGIYYDTFLEHYQDMLELFDIIVGLLKPHGIFSFFNG